MTEKEKINIQEVFAQIIEDQRFLHECIRSGNFEKIKERFEMKDNGILKPKRKQ